MRKTTMSTNNRKAIWVTEKLHKKIKLMAVKEDSTAIAIIESAVELWMRDHKLKVDNLKKQL